MARVLYTAEATVTGGRANGHGRSTDGVLDVQLRTPAEMGGEGGGTNPEQLFAVGFAACFEGALGVVGRRERAEVGDVSIDSRVSLLPTEDRGFKLAVELDVTLPQVADPEQAVRIVAAAIAWLASPGASYITGQYLVVDGGNSIAEERAAPA